MSKFKNRKPLAVSLAVICFVVILLSACGKKGDLYLPEEKTEASSAAGGSVEQNDEQKKNEKKDENNIQE